MKNILFPISALALAINVSNVSALQPLDESEMSSVSGQSGITLNTSTESIAASQISYEEDGVALQLNDFSLTGVNGANFDSSSVIDIDADGRLTIDSISGSRELSIGSIGLSGSNKSFMGIEGRYDYTSKFHIAGSGDGVYDLSGSEVQMHFDRLNFTDDGLAWILDDYTFSVIVNYGHLMFDNDTMTIDMGTESNRGLHLGYRVGAVGMSLDANNPIGFDDPLASTFGAVSFNLDAYGTFKIKAGGKTGEGITFIPGLTLINDDDNDGIDGNETPAFMYTDDGFIMLAKDFTGTFSTVSGFSLDLESDAESPYMAIRFADFDFAYSLNDLVLGGTQADYDNGLSQTLGSFKGEFHFRDDLVNNRLNYLYFRPGGAVGNDGITADISWNIVSDPYVTATDAQGDFNKPGALNTYLAMNDNGNYVYFNGFNSYGIGRVTMDMTSYAANPGTGGLYGATGLYSDNYDGNFDGLRIGFEDLQGSYSFAGVTVGRSEEEALDAPLMGGTELLLALEIFPSYDFKMNGNLTIAAGNINTGGQGITLNTDLYISEANAALTVNEEGRGVWLTGTTYDIHMRNATLDVTDNGLTINKGLAWSTIRVSDIKFGDKVNGESLGTFELSRLEDGTTISVASGGAGQVCIGGSGATAAACGADGGRFEDRGDQGLTVKVRAIFVKDDGTDPRYAGKGNSFSWTQPNGTTLALNNFSTNDGTGNPNQNDYGFNVDLAIDVAETVVLDDLGNEVLTAAGERPLGFAVFGRVHFKQLNIDGLTLAATPTSTPQTLIQGIVIQNADIQANLTATPIR
jgi:hypothetical protein